MTVVDAYSHVGLPRFQTTEDYVLSMAAAGIDRAVLSGFTSCPDLDRLHRALLDRPEVFRLAGIPVGTDRGEMEAFVRAQLDAGFTALRLADEDVLERPWLLDVVGAAGGLALVCGGSVSTDAGARVLLDHLGRHDDAVVVGGHFAGPREVSALGSGAAAELFQHPRFHVIFSRHGAFRPEVVEPWAEAVLGCTGWGRVMWGAESPVLYWRNETMGSAMAWVDRLGPSDGERAAFFGGNAERVFFGTGAVTTGPLELPADPWQYSSSQPAQLWMNSLQVDQTLAGRLVSGWFAGGGARNGPLGTYVEEVLDRALPPLGGPARGRAATGGGSG